MDFFKNMDKKSVEKILSSAKELLDGDKGGMIKEQIKNISPEQVGQLLKQKNISPNDLANLDQALKGANKDEIINRLKNLIDRK